MIRRLVVSSVLILGLVAIPGLADAGNIVGTWNATQMKQGGRIIKPAQLGLSMSVTVHRNGTYSFHMSMGKRSENESGTWTVKGNTLTTTRLKKDGKASKKVQTFTIAITGNTMTLTDKKGAVLTMVRRVVRKKG